MKRFIAILAVSAVMFNSSQVFANGSEILDRREANSIASHMEVFNPEKKAIAPISAKVDKPVAKEEAQKVEKKEEKKPSDIELVKDGVSQLSKVVEKAGVFFTDLSVVGIDLACAVVDTFAAFESFSLDSAKKAFNGYKEVFTKLPKLYESGKELVNETVSGVKKIVEAGKSLYNQAAPYVSSAINFVKSWWN